MNVLPSIRAVLAKEEIDPALVTCVIPKGQQCLCTIDSRVSLASKQMRVKALALGRGDTVPFHAHNHSEVVYVYQGQGTITVFVEVGQQIMKFVLSADSVSPVVVPRKFPHALYCSDTGTGSCCNVLAISAHYDVNHTVWESEFSVLPRR